MREEIPLEEALSGARLTRRHFVVALAAGGALATAGSLPRLAHAETTEPKTLEEAIKQAIGDRPVADGASLISLDVPQIAENGNTVPLGVSVASDMTPDNYVKTVHVFAAKNPRPGVATFHFTPHSGRAEASTRMRLAETQNVVVIAELSDGSAYMTEAEVKVTIGGCGG